MPNEWDLPFPKPAKRVALSMQTIRQPVTLGSSVPLWPVLSTLERGRRSAMLTMGREGCVGCWRTYPRILLTHDTTSWLEGLAGLSRLMTPFLM